MWVTFGLAMLLAAAVLYLPGMIALAPLRLQDARTLIFAPCASLFFYVVLVFAFSASGVFATGTLVLGGAGLISVLLCAIGFIVRRLIASKASVETGQDKKVPFGSVSAWLCAQRYLFLYVGD